MNYYIQAYENENSLMGTQNEGLVYNAKNSVKLKNKLSYFNPEKRATHIKIFTFTNLYDDKTIKHFKTIKL